MGRKIIDLDSECASDFVADLDIEKLNTDVESCCSQSIAMYSVQFAEFNSLHFSLMAVRVLR